MAKPVAPVFPPQPSYANPGESINMPLGALSRLPGRPDLMTDDQIANEVQNAKAKGIDFQAGPPPQAPPSPDYDAQTQAANKSALMNAALQMLAQRRVTAIDARRGTTGMETNAFAQPARDSAAAAAALPQAQAADRLTRQADYQKALQQYNDATTLAKNKNVELAQERVFGRAEGAQAQDALGNKKSIADSGNASKERIASAGNTSKQTIADWANSNKLSVAQLMADSRIKSAQINAAKQGLNGKQITAIAPDYEHNRTALDALNESEQIIKENPGVLDLMPNAMKYENGSFVITAQDPTAQRLAQNLALAHHYLIQNDKRRGTQFANSLLSEVLPKFGRDNDVALAGLGKLRNGVQATNTAIENANPNWDFGSMDWKPNAKAAIQGQTGAVTTQPAASAPRVAPARPQGPSRPASGGLSAEDRAQVQAFVNAGGDPKDPQNAAKLAKAKQLLAQ